MSQRIKNIVLGVIVAFIIVAIGYLEYKKPPHLSGPAPEVSAPSLSKVSETGQDRTSILSDKASKYSKAKEFVDPTGFVNTAPFKLSDLIGKKVILFDFWTYSCINCQRTLPYLKAWYDKYKDHGLVVIGVHTPEFDFEKDLGNVSKAVAAAGITYPVVLDSNSGTWQAYQNEYWPHEYLIDIDGYLVHDKIGEGEYDVTEAAIQAVLTERDQVLGIKDTIPTGTVNPSDVIQMNGDQVQSPETYFGAARNEYLQNGDQSKTGPQTLTIPATISSNVLYLGGTWNFQNEYAETTTPAEIDYTYNSKNVYFVASSQNGATIEISVDGKPLGALAGKDVGGDSTATIKDNRLYDLVHGDAYGTHTLKIQVKNGTLDAYTFTFG